MNEETPPHSGFESIKPRGIKHCPRCTTGQMQTRINHDSGEQFLGCSNYPYCKHTEPLPLDVQLRAQGAPTLPGFE